MEAGLKRMMTAFPEDPYPCLELATLHHQKAAYRKAEQILLEAKRRAPHDDRVVDRHVLALLISSEKRLKKGKMQLAAQDPEGAQERCPVCKAGIKKADTCRRCGADFSSIRRVDAEARFLYREAVEALAAGEPEKMYDHARLAVSKRNIPQTRRLRAVAALLCGDYLGALQHWRGI